MIAVSRVSSTYPPPPVRRISATVDLAARCAACVAILYSLLCIFA